MHKHMLYIFFLVSFLQILDHCVIIYIRKFSSRTPLTYRSSENDIKYDFCEQYIYVTKKHPGGWILVRNRANHIRACSIYNQCHWFWLTQSYVLPDRGKKTISRNDCGFYCYKKNNVMVLHYSCYIYLGMELER